MTPTHTHTHTDTKSTAAAAARNVYLPRRLSRSRAARTTRRLTTPCGTRRGTLYAHNYSVFDLHMRPIAVAIAVSAAVHIAT